MNLHHLNLFLQFARCLFGLLELLLPLHHFLRQPDDFLYGLSVLRVMTFPTVFMPMLILLYLGTSMLSDSIQKHSLAAKWSVGNDRLALAGALRNKITPVILGHGVAELQRNAVANAVVGLCLFTIGCVFIFLCINNITPIPMHNPILLLMSCVFIINVVSFRGILHAGQVYCNINKFIESIGKKRVEFEEDNVNADPPKKFKVPSADMLVMLHDAGFQHNIHSGLFIVDGKSQVFAMSEKNNAVSEELIRQEHKRIVSSMKTACEGIQQEDKSSSPLCDRLKSVQRDMKVKLDWEVTSLLLNCIACLGFFLFPILSYFPTSDIAFNSSAIFYGSLAGHSSWMLEPIYFAYHSHVNTSNKLHDAPGREKKDQ